MMARTPHSALFVALAASSALVATSPREAVATVVAVTPFAGPADLAGQAHRAVVGIVRVHYEVVETAQTRGADALVIGMVAASGDGYKLAISVREARSGRSVGAVLVPLFTSFIAEDDELRLRPLVLELLANVSALDSIFEARDDDAEIPPALQANAAASELPVAVRVFAGATLTQRALRFREEPGLDSGASFAGGSSAGLALDAEVTTRGRHRAGLALSVDRALAARISFGPEGDSLELPVAQTRWSASALGKTSWRNLELSASAGYFGYEYAVTSRPEGLRTPNAAYGAVALGGGARLCIRRLCANGGARYLFVVASAGITDAETFGSARMRGVELETALDVAITKLIGVRVGARLSRISLRFRGDGVWAQSLDDDPGQDVAGAVDSLAGGYAQVALQF